jgi:NADPH:quinone reductase-like Zn-dependent oxidoreductase
MRAIVHYNYGSPDVLQCEEVQKPTAGDDEVLVKVRAASVNPADWHTLRADPFLIRLMGDGLLKPKNKILGIDVAGQVEAVGRNVKEFQPGDEVFRTSKFGAFAGMCASEIDCC